jgi:hypothetical protein
MRNLVLVPVLYVLCCLWAGSALADDVQCEHGLFFIGDPLAASRIRLTGYCVYYSKNQRFVGYFPNGDSLITTLDRLPTSLFDSQGHTVNLIPPTGPPAPSDSLYEALKAKPLDQMTDREYEYFMLKKKAEIEKADKGSETTSARASLIAAQSMKSAANTYLWVSIIGLVLLVVLFLPLL